MNKKTITPNPLRPIDRIPTGKLPSALLELSEDVLSHRQSGSGVLPGFITSDSEDMCSFDGEDE